MELSSLLTQSGLSDKEAKVYLANLELGAATAHEIAKRSGVGRSTTYFILDTLSQNGLISYLDQGNIRHYSAEDPQELLKQSAKRYGAIETALPELQRLWGQSQDQTSVRFFQGLNNIKKMYDDLLTLNLKTYLVFGSADYWMKADEQWFTQYIERRAKAGVRIKLLVDDTSLARKQKEKEEKIKGAEVKIIPASFTKIKKPTSDVTILPDRVLFQNYGREMTTTVLHSVETAELMRIWHEMVWKML